MEKKDDKIPKQYLNILKDINLFNKIIKEEFDKKIVGEINARKVIFLCSCGRLVKNNNIASYNLLINDDAGSGKDYIAKNILEYLPEEQYIYKSRISPMVLTYWNNSTDNPNWSWNGKVFYLEDISENVLNSEVFKVMCSSGSDAVVLIKQKPITFKINGKPVIITTTATSIPNPELVRRFAILNLSEDKNQTKEIMKKHAEFCIKGIIPEYNEDIKKSLSFLRPYKVKIPYATKINEHFPDNHVIIRTLFPRFLDYIKASASFHQYQRKIDSENYILANEQDYEIARDCIETLKSNKFMIPLTITQKKILHEFLKSKDSGNFKLKGSAMLLHSIFNFISYQALQTNLGILTKYGIIKTSYDTDKLNRESLIYSLNEDYITFSESELPHFKEL